MAHRTAHLVGSLPGDSARDAMTTALDILGPYLKSLPDGETGARRDWVIPVIEGLRGHPALELSQQGDWSDYDKIPRMRVKKGSTLYGASLDFGHVAAVRDSFPDFQQAIAAAGRPDLAFQEGVPGAFDVAMFTLGPIAALRNRRAFTEATLAEIRSVAEITGANTMFQIEVPAELVLLAKAPGAARKPLAKLLARNITGIAAAAARGTRFAVHLCLGDMNNRALGTMSDVDPLVVLTNEIVRGWPAGRSLDLVHAPFAAANVPATTDRAFYTPLAKLKLPDKVRFAAGFAHEAQPLADQKSIRSIIDGHLGREVEIAAACGLGRRTPEGGRAVLERIAALCV
ncbi:MAG: hypothetical protein M3Y77_11900 [Actinomycetota bacterium]|nr:hypothetical protein [Actinomycetota bacterium]MDQ2847029.1 hypothetical protein [Actinomycetota bacterium]